MLWTVPAILAGLGRIYFLWRTWKSVPQLADLPKPELAAAPRLSIVFGACNEAETIEPALRSMLSCGYPNLEIVAVEDRSTDATWERLEAVARTDERVRALRITELAPGWLGKVHALDHGLRAASGEWVLLTDADVHFEPGALERAIAYASDREFDHLCALPEVRCEGFWLECAVVAFGRAFLMGQRLWAVEDPDSSAFVGVGAFNLVRRSALERAAATRGGGLAWLKAEVVDDLGVGLMMKSSGARCGVAGARDLVWVQWYESLGAMFRGLEKNVYAAAGCSLLAVAAGTAGLLYLELAPLVALAFASPWRFVAAGLLGVEVVIAIAGARWVGRPVGPALVAPLGALLLAAVFLRSGWLGTRRGGVDWRGTFYSREFLLSGRRVRVGRGAGSP